LAVQPIRAVLFDLWGTLIVEDPGIGQVRDELRIATAQAVLAELGFAYEAPDVRAGFIAAAIEHGRMHENEIDLSSRGRTVLYLRHLDHTLGERLDDDAWAQLDTAILTAALAHRPSMMPGAREALAEVKQLGLAIGLVSNTGTTPGTVLRRILDDYGLLEYLDPTVFSDEVELAKPAAAIFEHALDELGMQPHEVAFVGDQSVLDVFGARRAGMWSVQLGDRMAEGMEPHARIAALGELVAALRSLGLVDSG
jgi:putative hydrolase of the HAD superfamily